MPTTPTTIMSLANAQAWGSGSATDPLRAAYRKVQAVLTRNPRDHRAWRQAGEILRELSVASGQQQDEAMLDNLVLAELMPGFWQAQVALAWSYVRPGR